MRFNVTIELEHLTGPEQDVDTMIDAFAATIGKQNTANPPLKVSSGEWGPDGEFMESTYLVRLVEDKIQETFPAVD